MQNQSPYFKGTPMDPHPMHNSKAAMASPRKRKLQQQLTLISGTTAASNEFENLLSSSDSKQQLLRPTTAPHSSLETGERESPRFNESSAERGFYLESSLLTSNDPVSIW
jgi:hypothetical protein